MINEPLPLIGIIVGILILKPLKGGVYSSWVYIKLPFSCQESSAPRRGYLEELRSENPRLEEIRWLPERYRV